LLSRAGVQRLAACVLVSTSVSPAPGAKPDAISHRVPGIRARSSGFCTPQTNESSPAGAQAAGAFAESPMPAAWAAAPNAAAANRPTAAPRTPTRPPTGLSRPAVADHGVEE